MPEKDIRTEPHGCIVCSKLHTLYVVYDSDGKFVDCKVMSADGRRVPDAHRPLVACVRHSDEQVERAVARFYPGGYKEDKQDE
ncbi:MAG: hypothetical protein ACOYZ8_06245 [Chloroflexota bacterium]